MANIENQYNSLIDNNGGVYFPGIIDDETKSDNCLSPLYESITNALEAIKLKNNNRSYSERDYIKIRLYFTNTTDGNKKLDHIDIEDSGIGFNYNQFYSFATYKYNQKGFNNKGCGRFQSLLFFDKCKYISCFNCDEDNYQIEFDFSKNYAQSKGIKIISIKKTDTKDTGTILSLYPILDDSTFNFLDVRLLKKELIKKYALEFLLHSGCIPNITIQLFNNEKIIETETICKDTDIPSEKKECNFSLHFKQITDTFDDISDTNQVAQFKLTVIPFNMDVLDENAVYICCKNESVKLIEFNAFAKDDTLNNQRFLNFVSSDIFDKSSNIDSCRRDIKNMIKTEEQLYRVYSKKQFSLFNEFILQEDLENAVTKCFYKLYPIAKKKEITKQQRINSLKELFGLEDNSRLSIKTSDSSKAILEKYYRSEALKQASLDASFSEVYEQIKLLDINSDDYDEKFSKLNNDLNEKIPLRNKRALSKYLTNRKIVLDLFDLTIKNRLKAQSEDKRKEEEKRLHNILFKQHSDNTYTSNLWLLNEDFIYFTGYSEFKLNQLKGKDGKDLFDFSNLNEEDKKLLEDRDKKRPDIILFPKEGKCIIIELKAPGVHVNKYIGQTEDYARIIASCVSSNNKIDMFYSYLIVEKNNIFDVPSDYEEMYNLGNAYFSPSKKLKGIINGKRVDLGYIYSEILQYEDIYNRAKSRYKIFEDIISKIDLPSNKN